MPTYRGFTVLGWQQSSCVSFSFVFENFLKHSRSVYIKMNVNSGLKMNLSCRVLLLHEFCLGCGTSEATNNICSTICSPSVRHNIVLQSLSERYNDLPHSDRPLELGVGMHQFQSPTGFKKISFLRSPQKWFRRPEKASNESSILPNLLLKNQFFCYGT